MALTSIGQQKTPGRPAEITFEPETGLPSDDNELCLIGQMAASGDAASGTESVTGAYVAKVVNNVGDVDAATAEVNAKYGEGSQLAKMIIAAVKANAEISASSFPAIRAIALPSGAANFGPADEALTTVRRQMSRFFVSPFDGTDETLGNKLKAAVATISGAQRVDNGQYGAFGVVANMSVVDPSTLPKYDTQFIQCAWFRDTGSGDELNAYSLAEVAAAQAAILANLGIPYYPVDKQTIGGIPAPKKASDPISVGADGESETALNQGWTPIYVKPNGEVAFVRSITARLTQNADGVTKVTAYYDVQDFLVLYFWRKTQHVRFSQPDFTQRKAGTQDARDAKAEQIRLATLFQNQNMFQAVDKLASKFQIERNASDRSRFDTRTPVNVIPGLHVIASNIAATTEFDQITI